MGSEFTHLDARGAARMVDVSGKDITVRTATASGRVLVSAEVIALLRGDGVPKGDALAVAVRTVMSFPLTSTMRAAPRASRWVNSLPIRRLLAGP